MSERVNLTGSGTDPHYIANQREMLDDIKILVPQEHRESAAYHKGFEAGARWKEQRGLMASEWGFLLVLALHRYFKLFPQGSRRGFKYWQKIAERTPVR